MEESPKIQFLGYRYGPYKSSDDGKIFYGRSPVRLPAIDDLERTLKDDPKSIFISWLNAAIRTFSETVQTEPDNFPSLLLKGKTEDNLFPTLSDSEYNRQLLTNLAKDIKDEARPPDTDSLDKIVRESINGLAKKESYLSSLEKKFKPLVQLIMFSHINLYTHLKNKFSHFVYKFNFNYKPDLIGTEAHEHVSAETKDPSSYKTSEVLEEFNFYFDQFDSESMSSFLDSAKINEKILIIAELRACLFSENLSSYTKEQILSMAKVLGVELNKSLEQSKELGEAEQTILRNAVESLQQMQESTSEAPNYEGEIARVALEELKS